MKNRFLQIKSIGQLAGVCALATASMFAAAADLTNGVIKRIDVPNGKMTIKHEEIVNLDMPGMTMVFISKTRRLQVVLCRETPLGLLLRCRVTRW